MPRHLSDDTVFTHDDAATCLQGHVGEVDRRPVERGSGDQLALTAHKLEPLSTGTEACVKEQQGRRE